MGKGSGRSDAKNPTSAEYKAAMDNRSGQLNRDDQAYHSSRAHE